MASAGFDRVYQLLRQFIDGRLSSVDLDSFLRLVETACRKEYRLNRWIRNSALREGSDFRSVVLSLYGRQLRGGLTGGELQRAMQEHADLSDPTLLLYFERASRVIFARQLSRLYRELNPTPYRTRSQVMQLLRQDPRLVIYEHRGKPVWFALRESEDLYPAGLPWTARELLSIVYEVAGRGGRIPEMVQALIMEMAARRDHQGIMDIAALVAAITQWKEETLESGMLAAERSAKDTPLNSLIRQDAGRKVLKEVSSWVAVHVSKNGSSVHSEQYVRGTTDLVRDLVGLCDRAGHMSYLQLYIPGLTEELYRREHRFFDELATFVKRRFAELLWEK